MPKQKFGYLQKRTCFNSRSPGTVNQDLHTYDTRVLSPPDLAGFSLYIFASGDKEATENRLGKYLKIHS